MKLNVKQYQVIQEITKSTNDIVDANGLAISYLFNLSLGEVDGLSAKKYVKYLSKIKAKKPLFMFGSLFEVEAANLKFGRFLDITEWLKSDIDTQLDKIAASLLKEKTTHPLDCLRCQKMNAAIVIESVGKFIHSYTALLENFEWLFRDDDKVDGETEAERLRRMRKTHPFLKKFGWIFSAKEVSLHNGITLECAYNLPVIQALNDMCYLKAKSKYEVWQSKSV